MKLPLVVRAAVAASLGITATTTFTATAATAATATAVSTSTVGSPAVVTAVVTVPGDYATIQAAIEDAVPSTTIRVGAGTYLGPIEVPAKKLTIESIAGADHTTISVDGGTAVTLAGGDTLRGFTITGARASFGAGIEVGGVGAVIEQNVFRNNTEGGGGYGAAIGGNGASPIIDRNLFVGNSCDGQYLSGVVSFVNGSSPVLTNNVFVDNPCRAVNLTLPSGTTPKVINNTMVGNAAAVRDDNRVNASPHVYRNNLIAYNDVGYDNEFGGGEGSPLWDHNLVYGNVTDYKGIADQTGVNGNISADPAFVDLKKRDLRLSASSPAVDAGSATDAPDHDDLGTPRPLDGSDIDSTAAYDIGAYEQIKSGDLQVRFTSIHEHVSGTFVPFTGDFQADGKTDIFWYRAGPATDWIWWSDGVGGFPAQPVNVSGRYQPIAGDFNGDGAGDVFWYAPGSAADFLWTSTGRDSGTFTSTLQRVNGRYQPFAGDFNGDGRTDIFWYAPGSAADYLALADGRGGFSTKPVGVSGRYRPIVGDFDGDGDADIIWYAPGSAADYRWTSDGHGSFTPSSLRIDLRAQPIAGDFDGNGFADILWYRSDGPDQLWLNDEAGGFGSVAVNVGGSYVPIAGDFDGNGLTDVLWYAPGTHADYLWLTHLAI